MSRTCPGASPTATSAPKRRKTSAAASTTFGLVVICGAAEAGLDQIRFQQNPPPADPLLVKAHRTQSRHDCLGQRAVIALISGKKDGRAVRAQPPQQGITQCGRRHRARADEHVAPAELAAGQPFVTIIFVRHGIPLSSPPGPRAPAGTASRCATMFADRPTKPCVGLLAAKRHIRPDPATHNKAKRSSCAPKVHASANQSTAATFGRMSGLVGQSRQGHAGGFDVRAGHVVRGRAPKCCRSSSRLAAVADPAATSPPRGSEGSRPGRRCRSARILIAVGSTQGCVPIDPGPALKRRVVADELLLLHCRFRWRVR